MYKHFFYYICNEDNLSVSKMDIISFQNSLKYFCVVSAWYAPQEFKWLNCFFTLKSTDFG